MKKNKLYIFLSLITIIFLFSVAALCNQCGSTTDDKIDVGEEEGVSEEEESTTEEEEAVEEEDREVPTITLEIYEGPIAAEGLCYYRVQANVTGVPSGGNDKFRGARRGKLIAFINCGGDTGIRDGETINLGELKTLNLSIPWAIQQTLSA